MLDRAKETLSSIESKVRAMVEQFTGRAVVKTVQEYIAPVSEVLVGLHADLEEHRSQTARLHRQTTELNARTAALQQQLASAMGALAQVEATRSEAQAMHSRAEVMLAELQSMHTRAERRSRLCVVLVCLSFVFGLAAIVTLVIALAR